MEPRFDSSLTPHGLHLARPQPQYDSFIHHDALAALALAAAVLVLLPASVDAAAASTCQNGSSDTTCASQEYCDGTSSCCCTETWLGGREESQEGCVYAGPGGEGGEKENVREAAGLR